MAKPTIFTLNPLQKMAAGLALVTQRTIAGQPILAVHDDEELMRVQPGVSIVLANRPPESPGTLYISTKRVIWLSDSDRAKGYCVDFVSISLHAVSRDPEAYSSPCIYAQIDTGTEGEESDESDSESNEIDLSKITEMRLVPSDPSELDAMFAIFCECAELNPGPIDDNLDDEEEHNWIFSADQLEGENAVEKSLIGSLRFLFMQLVQMGIMTWLRQCFSDQRFEDAEEDMDNDDENNASRH